MGRLLAAVALAATIATAVVMLVITSVGGAATKHQAGYPGAGAWNATTAKAAKAALKARLPRGFSSAAIIAPGGGLFFAEGIKDYGNPGDGIHCIQTKSRKFGLPVLVPIWPAEGPAIVSFDLFNTDCPDGYYDIRIYDPDTGDGTADAGALFWVP
jgi:hypothetical protein